MLVNAQYIPVICWLLMIHN